MGVEGTLWKSSYGNIASKSMQCSQTLLKFSSPKWSTFRPIYILCRTAEFGIQKKKSRTEQKNVCINSINMFFFPLRAQSQWCYLFIFICTIISFGNKLFFIDNSAILFLFLFFWVFLFVCLFFGGCYLARDMSLSSGEVVSHRKWTATHSYNIVLFCVNSSKISDVTGVRAQNEAQSSKSSLLLQ